MMLPGRHRNEYVLLNQRFNEVIEQIRSLDRGLERIKKKLACDCKPV